MKRLLFIMSLISITFTSCEKWDEIWNGSPADPSTKTHVTVNFTQTVNGVELTTNNMIYTNEAGANYDVKTLKYIISNITLHGLWNEVEGDPVPNEWGDYDKPIKDWHFIDISDESTFSFTASVSPHNWTSISYTMGLDTGANKSDYFGHDYDGSYASRDVNMAWPDSLGGGYHYMKLEGAYNNNSTFYNTHTGGTMGGDYSFNNIDDVSIPREPGDVSININMEINNWYDSPNQIEFSSYGTGIMMDTTMQENIQQNGIADVFSVNVDK